MKVHPDKQTKSVSLTLALERYQSSPKFTKNLEKYEQVSPEEIKFPAFERFQHRLQSNKPNQLIPHKIHRSRQKNQQKSLQKRQNTSTLKKNFDSSEDEDELFNQCSSLTSKVQALKMQKYQNAIQQFEQQQQKKMLYILNIQQNNIRSKYGQLRKDLQVSFQQQKLKLLKHLDEINKFKSAYEAMNEQLSDKKKKIDKEYKESIVKIKQYKEKLISEWKRNSNQQIMKLGFKNL